MNLSVTTTPTKLAVPSSATPVIQNLGPADVYLDTKSNVTSSTGLKLESGGIYESSRDLGLGDDGALWLVTASGSADVRYMVVG